MRKSSLLTQDMAAEALLLVNPAVEGLFTGGLAKRRVLVAVVLDPISHTELAMLQYGELPRSEWSADYEAIACAKAALAARAGIDTAVVIRTMPHLLSAGDVKYQGGVNFHGIPVGASGIQSYFDEMVAGWIAAACKALCDRRMQEKVLPDDKLDFLK